MEITSNYLWNSGLSRTNQTKLCSIGSGINLCFHWHYRFPIPDLRPAVDRRPWWKQSLRKECLIFDFSAAEFNTSLSGSELPCHYNLSLKELHGMGNLEFTMFLIYWSGLVRRNCCEALEIAVISRYVNSRYNVKSSKLMNSDEDCVSK